MYHIGIDLGGTNIAVGILDQNKKIIHSASVPTNLPKPLEQLAKNIADFVHKVLCNCDISVGNVDAAGIGIPGTINPNNGVVEYANNLNFVQVPFTSILQKHFDFPLSACNDAKAAAGGEYVAGAGQGASSMVMITLGTGIGGAVILNGTLLDGFNYAAGEFGHMVIEYNGKACNCGRKGCFELYASATVLIEQAKNRLKQNSQSAMYQFCSRNLNAVTGKSIFDAVQANDTLAISVLQEFIHYLAEGTANIINLFQPEVVCIGGGLSGARDALIIPLKTAVAPLVYSKKRKNHSCSTGQQCRYYWCFCSFLLCLLYNIANYKKVFLKFEG